MKITRLGWINELPAPIPQSPDKPFDQRTLILENDHCLLHLRTGVKYNTYSACWLLANMDLIVANNNFNDVFPNGAEAILIDHNTKESE